MSILYRMTWLLVSISHIIADHMTIDYGSKQVLIMCHRLATPALIGRIIIATPRYHVNLLLVLSCCQIYSSHVSVVQKNKVIISPFHSVHLRCLSAEVVYQLQILSIIHAWVAKSDWFLVSFQIRRLEMLLFKHLHVEHLHTVSTSLVS